MLGYTSHPKCECGQHVTYARSKSDFLQFCSKECADKSEKPKLLRKQTSLDRFGYSSNLQAFQASTTPEKRSEISKRGSVAARANLQQAYGESVTNVMYVPEIKQRHIDAISSEGAQDRRIQSNIDNHGSWEKYREHMRCKMGIGEFSDFDRESYQDYSRLAWFYTNQNDLDLLENFDKRGRLDLREDAYHLDHKFSMLEGFRQNIPPEVIGSIHNLEMIPAADNIAKSDRCSITFGELLASIEIESMVQSSINN